MDRPWVEKYRPKELKSIVSQKDAVSMLASVVQSGQMPHLLFYGPPGTGKTSSIHAAAHEMFGEDYKQRVLELNASDQRGIDVVRTKIKNYARNAVPLNKMNTKSNRPMPNWKIVVLDEADMLTYEAQTALRRIMEVHAASTRFVLACNQIHRIIGPIFSRCSAYRFTPIPINEVQIFLKRIAEAENISLENNVLEALWEVAEGDLRRAVMLLQSASMLEKAPSVSLVHNISGFAPPSVAQQFYQAAKTSAAQAEKVADEIMLLGWDNCHILQCLVDAVIEDEIDDTLKSQLILEIISKHHAIIQGADASLQLVALALVMWKTIEMSKK